MKTRNLLVWALSLALAGSVATAQDLVFTSYGKGATGDGESVQAACLEFAGPTFPQHEIFCAAESGGEVAEITPEEASAIIKLQQITPIGGTDVWNAKAYLSELELGNGAQAGQYLEALTAAFWNDRVASNLAAGVLTAGPIGKGIPKPGGKPKPTPKRPKGKTPAVVTGKGSVEVKKVKLVPVKTVKQKFWDPDNFTDPKEHNPEKFRYLVKIVKEDGAVEEIIASQVEKPTSIINSASVVDETHTGTFALESESGIGFVIKVPEEHVHAAGPRDIHSKPVDGKPLDQQQTYLNELVEDVGLEPPSSVLSKTKKDGYNEVVYTGVDPITGTPNVEVTGVVVVTMFGKPFAAPEVLGKFKAYADAHDLPVIELEDPSVADLMTGAQSSKFD